MVPTIQFLIIAAMVWLSFVLNAAFGRRFVVRFGSALPAPAASVQIGFNPQTGAPVFAPPPQSLADQHWAVSRSWGGVFLCVQFVVCVLMLSALAADAWSVDYSTFTTVFYGVIRAHYSGGTTSYADICKPRYSSSDCPTMRAGAALSFAWTLIGFAASLLLMAKTFAISCCRTSPEMGYFAEWMVIAGRIQVIQYGFVCVLWALVPHLIIDDIFGGATLGSSWGLTMTCFVLSLALHFYYRFSIEYRRNGSPTLIVVNAPVAHVVVMQPHQPPVVIHMQQHQPQFVGQPQFAQPAYAAQAQYAQPIGQQYPSQVYGQPMYGQPQQPPQYAAYGQPQYAQAYQPAVAPPAYAPTQAQMHAEGSSPPTFPDVTKH